jgi:Tfp pilus assembly protein PilF
MKRAFATSLVVLVTALAIAGCRSSRNPAEAETQRRFGVQMAKMNLWREAMFRFRRATEMDPNAQTYNNLAVAYEATGDFDSAAKAYREALRLDRNNQFIAKNYSRFVEFTTKDKKRPNRTGAAAATTAAATSTAAPSPAATSTAAPAPAPTTPATPPTDTMTPPATSTAPAPPPPAPHQEGSR